MVKTLLKKQLAEIFKTYFFDFKKNKPRSKAKTAILFVVFALLIVFIAGFMFGAFAYMIRDIAAAEPFRWLYHAIFFLLAVLLGVFGSVFSTYSGLYLSKDNDLLLSMPIPVRVIMLTRLLGVYIMGLLYSATVIIPATVVYMITCPVTVGGVFGALLQIFNISVFVMVLSCALGYVVARISVKLKNKGYVTVIISVLFIALYYYLYFNATSFIGELIGNIALYGEKIKEHAHIIYVIGKAAEPDTVPTLAVTVAGIVLLVATMLVISKSFLKVATSSATVKKAQYKQKNTRRRSVFGAVLAKEAKRFASSPNYMLNCGFGILFLIAFGVLFIIEGDAVANIVNMFPSVFQRGFFVILAPAVCLIVSMNDIAAPSVSLEGKTLWQIRSLPVPTKTVLKAKYSFQILVNTIPTVFCVACIIAVLRPDPLTGVLLSLFCLLYVCFHALFSLFCGLLKPNLNWTNEIFAIKQGLDVLFAIFGGFGYCVAIGALWFLACRIMDARIYLAIALAVTAVLTFLLYRFINRKGVKLFEQL